MQGQNHFIALNISVLFGDAPPPIFLGGGVLIRFIVSFYFEVLSCGVSSE